MSLKRRNTIALLLILFASVCWTFGNQLLNGPNGDETETTTFSVYISNETETLAEVSSTEIEIMAEFSAAETKTAVRASSAEPEPDANASSAESETAVRASSAESSQPRKETDIIGAILFFTSAAAAAAAIFVFSSKNPLFGPDGVCLFSALAAAAIRILQMPGFISWTSAVLRLPALLRIMTTFIVLTSVRELLGWVRARLSLSWCLVHRIARRCPAPQLSLLVFTGWILLPLSGFVAFLYINTSYDMTMWAACAGFPAAAFLGFLCQWKYGADLNHFQKQLDNYRNGLPISAGSGAFSQTEAQLLDMQAQHEEAIRTAVTSERFKVELISNVSHDLRTPLTSILGYSELLQKETLSPEGQEQLRRLQQKAGYMSDLVEALFELTKVSSGAAESKKEQIDLVRLLEQTIGLFDDQLTGAGLNVRRSYCADSVPIITDGARMHQVFANLLGNAIKYALAGTRIYLEIRETPAAFLVRMMNTASYEMNFEPDEIMQRFVRGDKARSTQGSGLGLAIAQTYTESVGGAFWIAVDGDQFSAFVELPKNQN